MLKGGGEPRRSKHLFILALLALLLFLYVAGIVVREQFGIAVHVVNASPDALRNVRLRVVNKGYTHALGALGPGQHKRVFVKPAGESSIILDYTDPSGVEHTEMLAGLRGEWILG